MSKCQFFLPFLYLLKVISIAIYNIMYKFIPYFIISSFKTRAIYALCRIFLIFF